MHSIRTQVTTLTSVTMVYTHLMHGFLLLFHIVPVLPNDKKASVCEWEDDKQCEIDVLVRCAEALSIRYLAVCTVILHPYSRDELPHNIYMLARMLANNGGAHLLTLITLNFASYRRYRTLIDQTKCPRTMVLVYGDTQRLQSHFIQLSLEIDLAGPFWLLYLSEDTVIEKYLEAADLPFDVDLVVGQTKAVEPGTVVLREVYRVSREKPVLPVRVQEFGNWSREGGLVAPPHISLYYGNRRNNLEGVRFKVTTAASYPAVIYVRHKNGTTSISGYLATVWRELEERLNFTTDFTIPEDDTEGALRNGNWSGVTGMVVGGATQIGLAPITISATRSHYVDFLRPLITTRNTLFYKKPGTSIRWDGILRPFQTGIWLTILMWILVGAVCLRMLVRLGVASHQEVIGGGGESHAEFTLLNSFFCLLRAFSQQGTPFIPSALPGRIVILTTYLVSVVVLTAYSGALISFIAVEIPRVPFRNLKQLVAQNSYQVSVVKDSASFMYFANTSDPLLTAVYNMMEVDKLPLSHREGIRRLCEERKIAVAHFGPQALMDVLVLERNAVGDGCEIRQLPDALNTVYISIIIQKNNQYKDALNHHLDMMIYQGTLGRMRAQLWPAVASRRGGGGGGGGGKVEVRVQQVIPVYLLLLAGLALALFIFIFERFASKPARKISTESFSNLTIV